MKIRFALTAAATAVLGVSSIQAHAQADAAQVIFTNDKLTIIDAKGVERVAKQGDFIQPGERLITPPGVIGQIRLPDGTLLGARPGTDLKLESIVGALGKNILVLNEGNVRVVNVESPKGPKPMPMDVVSPISTLQITAGDGEAIHVKPGSKPGVEPGTYNRLQFGTAIVRNDKGELPLQLLQPIFAPKLGVPLTSIAFLPISLVKIEPIFTNSLSSTTLISPTLSTSLVGDLKTISPTNSQLLASSTLAGANLLSTKSSDSLNTALSGAASSNLGTYNPVGTTGTPYLAAGLANQYQVINVNLINTAALKPSVTQINGASIPLCVRTPSLCQPKLIRP